MSPELGTSNPWQSRMRTLLPAPLGPRMTVRGPAAISHVMPAMMLWAPTEKQTLSSASLNIGDLSIVPLRGRPDHLSCSVDYKDQRDQCDPQTQGEREVAFARLQCDRCRHDSCNAVDISADDHDSAYLGGSAS